MDGICDLISVPDCKEFVLVVFVDKGCLLCSVVSLSLTYKGSGSIGKCLISVILWCCVVVAKMLSNTDGALPELHADLHLATNLQ